MAAPSLDCAVCRIAPAAILVGALRGEALDAVGICAGCRQRLGELAGRFGSDLAGWKWAPLEAFPSDAFTLEGAAAVQEAEEILRRPPEDA